MTRVLPLTLVLFAASVCAAQIVPAKSLNPIVDDEKAPLPAYMTPEEALLPPLPVEGLRSPPTGTVYCPAEYEPMEGLLIRWGSYNSVLTEMTVDVTTLDPEAKMFIIVSGSSQQSSATSTLTSAGADMSQVEFLTAATNTVWIRDYGPRYIFEDGVRAVIDHTYNRPRPSDNQIPDFIAATWGEASYDIPLTHGGGNFHLFSNGEGFMSELILNENPGLTEAQILGYYQDYQNLDVTIMAPMPSSFDSTQHIDMWMMPLRDDHILIGDYTTTGGTPYAITEAAVTELLSRGYTVHRTPGWSSGGTHYTYTNAVIINDLMMIPRFNHANDSVAISTFQSALPGHTVTSIDCSSIIHAAGAIHCIVMHVPAYVTTMRVTPGGDLIASGQAGGPFDPPSRVYTIENTADIPMNYAVTTAAAWLDITNAGGTIPEGGTVDVTVSFNAQASSLPVGAYAANVDFTNLTDGSGDTVRGVQLDIGFTRVHDFPLDSDPGWSTEGLWAFGRPTGGGGQYGGPDPTGGHTGGDVYGYNLNGDYENSLPERHLTTTAIDCTGLTGCELRFWRWLGVETSTYDHAHVRVSNDGTNWTTIWQNSGEVADVSWTQQTYDISSIADDQPTVYIRWTMGTTDGSWQYCGWNIDDVEIWATPTQEPILGDIDGDFDVDFDDLNLLLAAYGTCEGETGFDPDANLNDDLCVTFDDLNILLANYGQGT